MCFGVDNDNGDEEDDDDVHEKCAGQRTIVIQDEKDTLAED